MKPEVVFISYYTPNYKKWAVQLQDSMSKQGLTYDVVCIDHQTTEESGKAKWQANVRYKPKFILDKLREHKDCKAVVWVDADALVERKPEALLKIREDLAVRFAPFPAKQPRKYELLSGTVYVKNSPEALKMMELWVKAMPFVKAEKRRLKQAELLKPEQQVLQALLTNWQRIPEKLYNNADGLKAILQPIPRCSVSVKDLAEPYCHIRGQGSDANAVISHGQASREWRWPERARRRAQMDAARGHRPPFKRRARVPKPQKAGMERRGPGPISRRRRRRMGA